MSAFLNNKFLRVCPYGKQTLAKMVEDCKRTMFFGATLTCMALIIWNNMFESYSNLYLLESLVLALYIVGMEIPNHLLQKKESTVYRELLLYFSRVKHRYTACRHMANAVLDAADSMTPEIQCLAEELYQVLMESDRKEKVREYILQKQANRYMKLFLIQAYEVSEKGGLFFEENIECLRTELMEEIYRRKQRAYEFAGYVFVAVTPFFTMPVLRQWGINFAPELEFFYAGTGVMLETVTFVVTLVIYRMILTAKEIVFFAENQEEKLWNGCRFYENELIKIIMRKLENMDGIIGRRIRTLILQSGERTSYGKLCLQMILLSIGTFLLFTGFYLNSHYVEKKAILERVDSIETIAPVAGEEKQAALKCYILEITNQCRLTPEITEEEIRELLRKKIHLGNRNMEQMVVEEIKKKLLQYKKTKISAGELLLCSLFGSFAGFFPVLKLFYRAKTIRAGAINEIRQFQALILMERKLQGITITGLLEDMEVFSQCFRMALKRCINAYNTGPMQALLRLKEEGGKLHESFEEIADAFLSVDEVGIELAFAEVESNRRLVEKMTQLEVKIDMEKKKDSTDLLAKVPMLLSVGAYFVLPFFSYSLQGVFEVFELLEEMKL